MAPFLTIAQVGNREYKLPWKVTIAGHTDSVSIDEVLLAGKLECSHKAFEIIDFTVSAGGACLFSEGGLYREAYCPTAVLTGNARRLIGRLQPGHRLYFTRVRLRNRAGQELLISSQQFQVCPAGTAARDRQTAPETQF